MIVTTKELFAHAYGKYAIGAYNINNLEQTMGLFEGNVRSKAPFIVQLSKGARSYTHKKMLEALMTTANEIFPDAIFAVHLDHGDEATCMDCIDSGVYSSVMIDASAYPYDENVAISIGCRSAYARRVRQSSSGLPPLAQTSTYRDVPRNGLRKHSW